LKNTEIKYNGNTEVEQLIFYKN